MGNSNVKDQWKETLETMLSDFRAKNPSDGRSDREVLTSLMDHMVSSGLVKMQGGKYVLPEIVG